MQVTWNNIFFVRQQNFKSQKKKAENINLPATNKNTDKLLSLYLHNKAQLNVSSVLNFGSSNYLTDKVIERYHDLKPNIIPDKYQIKAAEALERGDTVIVDAPTGTGKTLIGEYSEAKNLQENNTTYYTTPLKALTNQKYGDFSEEFQKENVGIMTGDIKYNITAPINVMTTEIYRNMLSPNQEENEKMQHKPGTVILDELHYMNDEDRGATWEESIMLSPSDTQILALSATIGNSNKLKDWMQHINPSKNVTLIKVSPQERHVPLKFYSFDQTGLKEIFDSSINIKELSKTLKDEDSPDRIKQVLKEMTEKIHPEKEATPQEGMRTLLELFEYGSKQQIPADDLVEKLKEKYFTQEDAEKIALTLANEKTALPAETQPFSKNKDEKGINPEAVNALLDNLHGVKKSDKSKMPAIVFVFSKKDCENLADQYSEHISKTRDKLDSKKVKKKKQEEFLRISKQEKKERQQKINQKINEYRQKGIVLGSEFNNDARKRLLNGVAIHNAGMLPGYKKLVEELFQEKLIDVVFATETLAAGINMPAKTTVLTSLEKPAGINNGEVTKRPLSVNEFQQMTGRAGRRGIDKVGNVIIMPESNKDLEKAQYLATAEPDEIKSKLNISYSLLIEFLKTGKGVYNSQIADKFLDRSFLVYNSPNPETTKNTTKEKLNNIKDTMEELGFIQQTDDGTYKIMPKGELIPEIKGTNELFMAQAIAEGTFFTLSPEELISAAASLTNEKASPRKNEANGEKPQESKEELKGSKLGYTLKQMKESAKEINDKQLINLGLDSFLSHEIKIDPTFAKYVSEWAQPSENNEEQWKKIITEMEEKRLIKFEGDFFKSINSTINLLNQIDNLSMKMAQEADESMKSYYEQTSKTAQKAVELLSKSPIRDDIKI